MARYQADVTTAQASRYLQQLCKHWSHRFAVEFDAERGLVRMGGADCAFAASPERLVLTLEGEAAARLRTVVAEHLQRFAFREALVVDWVEHAQA